MGLAQPLAAAGALYVTHMRTETDAILDAMGEAFEIGRHGRVPVMISHLKCAGIANWGRSGEVLKPSTAARNAQPAGCDCYPYAAGSSTLDLRQVDPRVEDHDHLEHAASRSRRPVSRSRSPRRGTCSQLEAARRCSRPARSITASRKKTCAAFSRIPQR